MSELTIKVEPFSWEDNFSEEALEYFSGIQRELPYDTAQNIGMALGKLKLMEERGLHPEVLEQIVERLEERK